jgi:pullulanase
LNYYSPFLLFLKSFVQFKYTKIKKSSTDTFSIVKNKTTLSPSYFSISVLIMTIMYYGQLQAQTFTKKEIIQGYSFKEDTTYFLFNEELYKVSPKKVVVTGSFRGWSADMDDPKWELHKQAGKLWVLSFYNPIFKNILPNSPFKFRVDKGDWLSPPSESQNVEGGNLMFEKGTKLPSLSAEIVDEKTIWAEVFGYKTVRPLDKEKFILTDVKGNRIPLATAMPNTSTKSLLVPEKPLDKRRVYYLELEGTGLKTDVSFDGWFRNLYSDKELGANISSDGKTTSFRIFTPRADLVKLYLYKERLDTIAYKIIDMKMDKDGVWEAVEDGDLKGIWYDFTVHGPDEPGSFFYNKVPKHISDPYARVSDDSFGKCRVWNKTTPAKPLKNGIPKLEDVIAYEVHIQDFTDRLPVSNELKGTIPAMHVKGLRNSKGEKIGFDYLLDLGINVVHLQPMQEFLHYPDDEWQEAFLNDPFMIKHGINKESYEWGYRTSHAFAVETRYRKKDSDFGEQREQFRDLVQAFHDHGIAVIIDVVFNHTAENMDGRNFFFNFDVLDRQYFYRTKNLKHIGEYGNETKSENRPMMQRWFIDQCKHFVEEFGIDGFRIDLAGQTDKQTLSAITHAIGKDKIVYGEPWIDSNDPNYEANPDWDWYKHDSPIVFFQDDFRNIIKGGAWVPKNKKTDRGYAGGLANLREEVKKGLTCTFTDEKSPLSGINYLDIHDNWALADQFATQDWDGRFGVDEGPYKIAAVILYTSLGPIVTHGGTEIMRSKGLAALEETVKESRTGKHYFHGKRDTYNMRTPNHYIWETVGTSDPSQSGFADYKNMQAYWRGLNKFRLSEHGKVFRQNNPVPKDYYQWIDHENKYMLGYIVDQKVMVLINTEDKENTFEKVFLPSGKWKKIADLHTVDHIKGVKGKESRLKGTKTYDITIPPTGLGIWIKE